MKSIPKKVHMIEGFSLLWFLLLLPGVAFLYASVGHGGASGYLALMALFSFAPDFMKPTALLLNLFVAGIAFYQFYRANYFNKQLFIPFVITSVPASFFGGRLQLDPTLYKKILAVLLLIALVRMLWPQSSRAIEIKPLNIGLALSFGLLIGLFSGMIGIGGGIMLTPLIMLFRWGNVKTAAAVSALFIWVNSAAGMGGQLSRGVELSPQAWLLVLVAFGGGLLGSYFGSQKWSTKRVEWLLSGVLFLASMKLLIF
ncbi:MAG: sulfite exporter TauE/SafE family protein [Flavobacteriaceae bacterium]